MNELTIDSVIESYVIQRDFKKGITDRHKVELVQVNGNLKQMENWLHNELNKQGLESTKCEHGTAYKVTRTNVKIESWDDFLQFVKDNDMFHMLERRAAKTAVTEFLEAQGELPTGLSINQDVSVNIRR